MTADAGLIRINDLERPVFPAEVQPIIEAMDAMAADFPLDLDVLEQKACAETGLSDFGARDFEERLEVFLAALQEIPQLAGRGLVSFHTQVVQMLRNRLLLTELFKRHPEALEIDIAKPIIIAGLPRTGTTHLHNLLSADPALRSLPYWESLEPFPADAERGIEPDPRIERTELAVTVMNQAMPLFPLMHEMTTWHVHEEIQLLAIDFSTMFFETLGDVPRWVEYYANHDQTPHYRYLKTILQGLQHERGGDRWVLKTPQHLEQFPVLAEVFPDATYVVTHRDPVSVMVSMATMIAYTSRMHRDIVDTHRVGQAWADRLERMLNSCVEHRSALPAGQAIDVRYDDLIKGELDIVATIYDLAGQPLTEAADSAMRGYLDEHRKGRLGSIEYHPEDLGLDRDDLRRRFARYVDRFLS